MSQTPANQSDFQENESIFHLQAPFAPTGDQPQAIEALAAGVLAGDKGQTLLGVTGSGKTFTMANIIARCNRPTLILEPNKTLASQICTEMRGFFPDDAVEYFVSYYDYYQPEAYIPSTDTYIEKDSAINDEIDRLRHSATAAVRERSDVIIVASVSCIYSMGDPSEYEGMMVSMPVSGLCPLSVDTSIKSRGDTNSLLFSIWGGLSSAQLATIAASTANTTNFFIIC